MLLYHHACILDFVQPGPQKGQNLVEILDEPEICKTGEVDCWDSHSGDGDVFEYHEALDYEAPYQWLADRVGYWPAAWFAVGSLKGYWPLDMTHYRHQFKDSDNFDYDPRALLSWKNLDPVDYLDYDYWHCILNATVYPHGEQRPHTRRSIMKNLDRRAESWVMKRSWAESKWIRESLKPQGSVQAVVPEIDYLTADQIRVPDQQAKEILVARGFEEKKIIIRRYPPRSY
jgi:hypothetical protein